MHSVHLVSMVTGKILTSESFTESEHHRNIKRIYSPTGFEDGVRVLTVLIPDHCFSVHFKRKYIN